MAWYEYVPSAVLFLVARLYLEEMLCALSLFSWTLVILLASPMVSSSTLVVLFSTLFLLHGAVLGFSPRFARESPPDLSSFTSALKESREKKCLKEVNKEELRIVEDQFRDRKGRRVFLRGVNLSGRSKLPAGVTTGKLVNLGLKKSKSREDELLVELAQLKDFEDREVDLKEVPLDFRDEAPSFKGRPFPLEHADFHLRTLRSAGFTFLRFLVTWEAIEPEEEKYDFEYLDYVSKVVKKCDEHGISLVIDPHQDAWSRFSGGDGAPRWTLERLGFEIENFFETKGAVSHDFCGPSFPKMAWTSNYMLYVTATMFTLFFGGREFAPRCLVAGENVQDWLQKRYINAMKKLAVYLKDCPNVLGFETMNEPSAGFIGRHSGSNPLDVFSGALPLGWVVSPWDGIQMANGQTKRIQFFKGPFQLGGYECCNEQGLRVWKDGVQDIWEAHGVWGRNEGGKPVLLNPDYFKIDGEGEEGFQAKYQRPFWKRYAEGIRSVVSPTTLIFTDPTVELDSPQIHVTNSMDALPDGGHVWSPHWYEGLTLISGRYRSWLGVNARSKVFPLLLGPGAALRGLRLSLEGIKEGGAAVGPTMLGEFGTPWIGSQTSRAAETTFSAVDGALFSAQTLWNYTPDHKEDGQGDGWNKEDLSIFTSSNGGVLRVPESVRPHPKRLAGKPLTFSFNSLSPLKPFVFEFESEENVTTNESLFFIPYLHYPQGIKIQVSDGIFEVDSSNQTLRYFHDPSFKLHRVSICTPPSSLPQQERRPRSPKWLGVLGGVVGVGVGLALSMRGGGGRRELSALGEDPKDGDHEELREPLTPAELVPPSL